MVLRARSLATLASLVVAGALTVPGPAQSALPRASPSMSQGTSPLQTALSKTRVEIQTGTGEFESYAPMIGVDAPIPLTFRWRTSEAGATGGEWEVTTTPSGGTPAVVATGKLTGAPAPGHVALFTLPASTFLASAPPATEKTYSLRVRATGASGQPLGVASPAVTISQGPPAAPIHFDADMGGLPAPYVEPGHPELLLLSYRPLLKQTADVSAVVLEFYNTKATPTDAVEVRVDDLNQVARMSGGTAYVPALAKGEKFRVHVPLRPAVNTVNGVPVTSSEIAWKARYANGVKLLVGTSKVGSPYVQYRQPPVVQAQADACTGLGCTTGSAPYTAHIDVTADINKGDLNIAVSDNFILAGDYNQFALYDKRTRQKLSLAGSDLANHPTAVENGGAATLFRDFWIGTSSKNLNKTLFANAVIPCDPANPFSTPLPTPPGMTLAANKVYPSSSCINDFYDTRVTYDAARKRFWIVTHGRHPLTEGFCVSENPKVAGAPPAGTCAKINALATRATFVAVSKDEDPRHGFYTYHVATDYQDWPEMGLGGDYAVFHHNWNAKKIHFYDASKLASGVKDALGAPYDPSDFPGAGAVRLPRHRGDTKGVTYFVAFAGKTISVYAIKGQATGGRPTLIGPSTYSDPDNVGIGVQDVVVRDGYLYCVGDTATTNNHDVLGSQVRVWRIPVGFDGAAVTIGSAQAKRWTLASSGLSFDYPTVEATAGGDVLVGFRAYSGTQGTQARYAVLRSGESDFRASEVLQQPKAPGWGGRIDYERSTLDPSDERTVWMNLGARGINVVGAVPLF